ncbi:MAG: sulfatase family protein [Planctomycetota bacterium]|jgi:uncharacterized sulfatase
MDPANPQQSPDAPRRPARLRSRLALGLALIGSGFACGGSDTEPTGATQRTPAELPDDPPNIVLFVSDDHNKRDLGCYGNEVVRSPRIDALAAEGLMMHRMFAMTAMCTPSRSVLYTGLSPAHNGARENHSTVFRGTKTFPHHFKALGYRVALAGKGHVGYDVDFPMEYMPYSAGLEPVEEFLADESGQPFFLVVSSEEPHAPHEHGRFDPEEIPLPPSLVDTPALRRTLAGYYGDIERLDDEVGAVLDLLDRMDLAEDTLFIYTADHGYGLFAKWSCYDAGLNVPFIARWPGVIPPGSESRAMVGFEDVLPTLLAAAGGEPISALDGTSALHVLLGERDEHREILYATHTNEGTLRGNEYPIRAVRTATHKYIRNLKPEAAFRNSMTHDIDGRQRDDESQPWGSWKLAAASDEFAARRVQAYRKRPAEELYDLRTDPHEMNNLADDPAQHDVLVTLRAELDAWLATQDQGL